MHFRHRQTDRRTDTDIVAYARDVYISSRAKNEMESTSTVRVVGPLQHFSPGAPSFFVSPLPHLEPPLLHRRYDNGDCDH